MCDYSKKHNALGVKGIDHCKEFCYFFKFGKLSGSFYSKLFKFEILIYYLVELKTKNIIGLHSSVPTEDNFWAQAYLTWHFRHALFELPVQWSTNHYCVYLRYFVFWKSHIERTIWSHLKKKKKNLMIHCRCVFLHWI